MIWIIVAVYILGFIAVYAVMYKNVGWFDRNYSKSGLVRAAILWPFTVPLAIIVAVIESAVDRMEEK